MTHRYDDNEPDRARALLDTIETRILTSIGEVMVTDDLAPKTVLASHLIMANALVELTGKVMAALLHEHPERRPQCLQLIDHLARHLSPPAVGRSH